MQRLDKWLFFTRVTKTRSLAQKLIKGGHVRVDGERKIQPSQNIAPSMVLTIAYANRIRVYRVLEPGTRRGPASEAALLYEDISPPVPLKDRPLPKPFIPVREAGAGRPTKKQRRQTDHLLGKS